MRSCRRRPGANRDRWHASREEQLAEDIEDLHFAVGERQGSGRTPVAVVASATLRSWLSELQAAGISPNTLYAEASLVPSTPGQVTAVLDGPNITIRLDGAAPLVVPSEPVGAAFDLAEAQRTDTLPGLEPSPLGMLLYTAPADWQARRAEFDALRSRFTNIKVQLLPNGPVALLAQQLGSAAAINLLQGTHAPKSEASANWRAWRWAALLAGILFTVHVGAKSYELMRLKKAEVTLDRSLNEVMRQAMPDDPSLRNARQRVEQRLLALRGNAVNGGSMLGALGALANAKNSVPAAALKGFTFRDGTLELRITAPDAASLDAVAQQFNANGWRAQLLSGTAAGEIYQGRIEVKSPAAGGRS
jgi:general secretion pathway protein L